MDQPEQRNLTLAELKSMRIIAEVAANNATSQVAGKRNWFKASQIAEGLLISPEEAYFVAAFSPAKVLLLLELATTFEQAQRPVQSVIQSAQNA